MAQKRSVTEKRSVTMKGNPFELSGAGVKVGDRAPDFAALTNDLQEFRLSALKGKVRVLVSVPSLDTPVCDLESRRFNEEAARLGERVRVLVLSMDLPFAQKRWCAAAGVERVQTLSDHREAAFGKAYGLLIPTLRLLARAVIVVDGTGTVRYVQLVQEIGQEPDYQAVLKAVQELL
jgi:thioredoxin-dependent peroxiredoxin